MKVALDRKAEFPCFGKPVNVGRGVRICASENTHVSLNAGALLGKKVQDVAIAEPHFARKKDTPLFFVAGTKRMRCPA